MSPSVSRPEVSMSKWALTRHSHELVLHGRRGSAVETMVKGFWVTQLVRCRLIPNLQVTVPFTMECSIQVTIQLHTSIG